VRRAPASRMTGGTWFRTISKSTAVQEIDEASVEQRQDADGENDESQVGMSRRAAMGRWRPPNAATAVRSNSPRYCGSCDRDPRAARQLVGPMKSMVRPILTTRPRGERPAFRISSSC